MGIEDVCKTMPKLELHAHLNGCISNETLRRLISENEHSDGRNYPFQLSKTCRTLSECFSVFKQIHNMIRTKEILYQVTRDVINDFAADNVIYLELRTTPKKVFEIPSKRTYLETVIAAIINCKEETKSILVKLIISIDREKGPEEGAENVDLAIELFKEYPDVAVGMDLSGNPTQGNIVWILPLLSKAKDAGLKVTCHLSEIIAIEETDRLLEFNGIDRFGHGLFIHPSFGGTPSQWELVKSKRIPIEACITSNLLSGVSKSLEEHYVRVLHQEGLPFVICTDDSAMFSTTLTAEYLKFLEIVPTSLPELKDLCLNSVSYAFASDTEKNTLVDIITKWWSDPMNIQ